MEKKKLLVHCNTCDLRSLNKELLDQYEAITVHAVTILTSPRVQSLTASYDLRLDCVTLLSLEEGTELIQQNGIYRMKRGERIPEHEFCICINGKVIIEEGTEELLKKCAFLSVNGKVICPHSMLPLLPQMQLNGKTDVYPDGAIVLDSVFVPDRVFALRAKEQVYFAAAKVILCEETLDVAELCRRGARFKTPKALIAEPLLEEALSLFDDETKVEVLPAGMRYLNEDLVLGKNELQIYGTSLYVDGNVTVEEESVIEELQRLKVKGTLRIKEQLLPALQQMAEKLVYDKLVVQRGIWIADKISLLVDAELLEQYEEIHISDVVNVKLAPSITSKQILQQLHFSDCVNISCSSKQKSAVEMTSEDVASIGAMEDEEEQERQRLAKENTKVVHANHYVF